MWSASTRDSDLEKAVTSVQKYLNNDAPMQGIIGETEENTGIEFGSSLEAYCGSSMTLEEKLFVDEVIVVEVAKNED